MMPILAELQTLLGGAEPTLPALWLMALARHLGWAVVLAWLAMRLWPASKSGPHYWRIGCAGLLALAALLPGSVSLAYGLGLSFQIPSLLTVALCLQQLLRRRAPVPVSSDPRDKLIAAMLGIALGWWLLLDTFALMPGSTYAWGYGTTSLVVWVAIAALLALAQRTISGGILLLLLALVFALTRLSSGNAWDALLDPLLWFWLHGYVARAAWRHWFPAARSPSLP